MQHSGSALSQVEGITCVTCDHAKDVCVVSFLSGWILVFKSMTIRLKTLFPVRHLTHLITLYLDLRATVLLGYLLLKKGERERERERKRHFLEGKSTDQQ